MSDSCDPMDCSLPGSSVHGILYHWATWEAGYTYFIYIKFASYIFIVCLLCARHFQCLHTVCYCIQLTNPQEDRSYDFHFIDEKMEAHEASNLPRLAQSHTDDVWEKSMLH